MIVAAGNAMNDALRQWVDAQEQVAVAVAHGDAGLIAAAQLAAGQRELGLAQNAYQREAAIAKIQDAQTAATEAARATAQGQTAIATAQDYGNTVAQANDALAGANRQLSLAQNTQERLQGQADLLNAQAQLEQAMADRATEVGQLMASETVDPVQQAQAIMQGAAQALTHTVGLDNRIKAQTTFNQAKIQWEQALIQQREDSINFQFQMNDISSGQAVKQLQDLLKLQGLTRADRQQILEQIRRYQLGLETPIGGNQFDLAPGNIRLPSFYDVFHGLGRTRQAAMNTQMAVNAPTQINVYVRQANDVPQVADAIDRATSSNLRQRLRAAGVR
jgi:hypothetical protein